MKIFNRNPLGEGNKVILAIQGGGPRVVVSNAAFHAKVRGSVPGLGERNKKCFFPIHV